LDSRPDEASDVRSEHHREAIAFQTRDRDAKGLF